MINLILYGSQNLSNCKFNTSSLPGFRGNTSAIQKIDNARFPGSTVVDKKISDKSITLNGTIRATSSVDIDEVIREYSLALSKENRYFRVTPNWYEFTPLADSSGFQIIGDTTSLSFDTSSFQYGSGSIKFSNNTALATGYAGVYTSSGTVQNIASYITDGAFEAWIYLPQTDGVTGITLRMGSNSSNYYYGTATAQYDGTAFEAGWNYISLSTSSCVMSGVVDPYSFGAYIYMAINYGALMTNRTDFRFGGMIFQQESRTRNYKSYTAQLNIDDNHYDISRANCTVSILAYEGIAESTSSYNVLGLSNQTTATNTATVTFNGSYTPLPVLSFNFNSATNVTSMTLANNTTGDSVAITRTYTAGDKIIIDTKNRSVTANGVAVDYDDVLPRFILGENALQLSISTSGLENVTFTTQNTNLTGEV